MSNPARDVFRFYGRRKGKILRRGRQELVEKHLPRLRITIPSSGQLNVESLFSWRPEAVWLEIGFGAGEHLIAQAELNPRIAFIAAEVFLNGIASVIKNVVDKKLSNIRILDNDVRLLLPFLPNSSINKVFLLFPDPWPKSRHAKRRFINPVNLNELGRIMSSGSELRFATDNLVNLRWCLRHIPSHPAFIWPVNSAQDWRERPLDSFPTRYEKKAIELGRAPVYLTFRRCTHDVNPGLSDDEFIII